MPVEIHHILTPNRFLGARSQQVVTSAFELAQTFGAKLSLLHVIEVPVYAIEVSLPLEDLERDARQKLALLHPEAGATHVDVTRLVRAGRTLSENPGDSGGRAGGLNRHGHARTHRPCSSGHGERRRARGPPGAVPGAHDPTARGAFDRLAHHRDLTGRQPTSPAVSLVARWVADPSAGVRAAVDRCPACGEKYKLRNSFNTDIEQLLREKKPFILH